MAKIKHAQIDDYQLAEITGLSTALGLKADKTQINGTAGRFVIYAATGLAESTKLFEGTNGLGIGFGTNSGITHPITINAGSTGIAFYTNNDGTNYRRFVIRENGGNLTITAEQGGNGTLGGMIFDVAGNQLIVSPSQGDSGAVRSISSASQPGANQNVVAGTQTGTTGRTHGLALRPTINKSGDSSFGCILVSPFISSAGTGEKILLDLGSNTVAAGGVSPVHTSVFRVLLDQIVTSIPFNSTSGASFSLPVTVPNGTLSGHAVNLSQLNAVANNKPVRMLTGNTTITTADYYVALTSGNGTFTLPTGLTTNMEFVIKNKGTGVLTVGGTVDGITNPQFNTQGSGLRVQWNGTAFDKTGSF